eukprot:s3957_g2.t1
MPGTTRYMVGEMLMSRSAFHNPTRCLVRRLVASAYRSYSETLCSYANLQDSPKGAEGVDEYLSRVMAELLPWAQNRFGLSPEPSERYFGGSSFGGICALYMAMRFPGEWAGVMVESPSFWAGDGRYMADVAQHDKDWPNRMYLAMGEFEYTGFRGTERPWGRDP